MHDSLLQYLPEWLQWVVSGGLVASAVVAIGKAVSVMQKLKAWLGDAAKEALKPIIVEYSANGQLNRIEARLEGHIEDADQMWVEIRADIEDISEEG